VVGSAIAAFGQFCSLWVVVYTACRLSCCEARVGVETETGAGVDDTDGAVPQHEGKR